MIISAESNKKLKHHIDICLKLYMLKKYKIKKKNIPNNKGRGEGGVQYIFSVDQSSLMQGQSSAVFCRSIFVLFKTNILHFKKGKISYTKILLEISLSVFGSWSWLLITSYTHNSYEEMKWDKPQTLVNAQYLRRLPVFFFIIIQIAWLLPLKKNSNISFMTN